MAISTLGVSATFALVSACVYFYVGWRLSRRKVSESARTASMLFTLWWYALGGVTLVGGVQSIAASAGVIDLTVAVTLTYVSLLVLCLGLWGLLYYLVYVFTGSQRALWPLTVFYIVYYFLLVYYITASGPNGVTIGRWSATLSYEHQVQGVVFAVVVLLLLVPQIVGALAYFTLFFKLKERTQRYRIALVSWSIVVWFGTALLATGAGVSQNDYYQVGSKLLALGASLAILFAYVPPAWVQRRYGITAVDAAAPEPPARAPGAS